MEIRIKIYQKKLLSMLICFGVYTTGSDQDILGREGEVLGIGY
jgi:hypothetical protein